MRPQVDWRLYLVTDRGLIGDRDLETVVEQAVRGGVTVVQLREKDFPTRDFIELARRLMRRLEPFSVPLIINDRIDVALAAGAQGVHVGQSDMLYADARRLMGPDALIGVSVETPEQAREAEDWDVDCLGVSPIFSTPTKTDTGQPWGLDGLRALRASSRHKLVAIGGIHPQNAADIVSAGADGIAVVSAICSADDPEKAARELRAAFA